MLVNLYDHIPVSYFDNEVKKTHKKRNKLFLLAFKYKI